MLNAVHNGNISDSVIYEKKICYLLQPIMANRFIASKIKIPSSAVRVQIVARQAHYKRKHKE